MARTALTVTQPAHGGAQLAFTAADLVNGNLFANDGRTVLIVRNTGGAPVNITLRTNRFEDMDLKVPDRVVAVPNGIIALMLGPFPPDIYNQADSSVWVDCAAALSLVALSVS